MSYLLAHDLGTTGNKANLFDPSGRLCASHLETYGVTYPHPQWAEQDPSDWWRAVCDSTRALLRAVPDAKDNIAAVSFSGQMMGVIPVDRAHRPLRRAIIWADQRAVAEADLVSDRCGQNEVYNRTGHRISPAYTVAKILWLKRNEPEVYGQAQKFLCAKDYASLMLAGTLMTDYSDASGSNIFDLRTRTWCSDYLGRLELDEQQLPEIVSSPTVIGTVTRAAAEATGLPAGTPVVAGGGDGACAAAGAGVIEPGACYCNLGSSAWISFSSGQPLLDPQRRTFTFHHVHPARYTPMGTMQAAGGARDWLARVAGQVDDEEIEHVPPGAGELMFLPYLIGERSPWWNPHARGAFIGLTMQTTKVDMARAVLEGVAYNLRLILDSLASQGANIQAVRFIGGGARSAVWAQLLADVFDKPIQVLDLAADATAWGAAVVGGIGIGLYKDWSIAAARSQVTRTYEPDAQHVARYADLLANFSKAYYALEPINEQLTVGGQS